MSGDAGSDANNATNDGGAVIGIDNRYCSPGDVATFGGADGPASLPRAYTNTNRTSSASPGAVLKLCPRAECDYQDLASALAAAACGSTISAHRRKRARREHAASDGKDPGADIDAVNAAIAGVAP